MRQGDYDQLEIKEELSKFINLLQTDFKSSPQVLTEHRPSHEYPLAKKLSIILSASEPESSSLDKQNSNPSANRSFDTNEKLAESITGRGGLVQSLMATNLTPTQFKIVEKIREYIEELRGQNDRYVLKLQECKREVVAEKKANDEMLGVLVKLDKQEKELWQNYNLLSEKYEEVSERNRVLEGEFEALKESVIALQNDNDFMKKLIFHANQNYEVLERRCKELESGRERSGDTTDRRSVKKSSVDNLLKSAKTRKNGQSPNHSEVPRSASPQNFQDIYRKMIIRTLKFKGRSPHHPN